MRREILSLRRGDSGCCPGHDKFPADTYKNRRSKKARSRDRKIENRTVRRLQDRVLDRMLRDAEAST